MHERPAAAVARDVAHFHWDFEDTRGVESGDERPCRAVEPAAGGRAGDDFNRAFGLPGHAGFSCQICGTDQVVVRFQSSSSLMMSSSSQTPSCASISTRGSVPSFGETMLHGLTGARRYRRAPGQTSIQILELDGIGLIADLVCIPALN